MAKLIHSKGPDQPGKHSEMTFYGATSCSASLKNGNPCRNKAYFLSQQKYLCGVHSKSDSQRTQLPKDPHASTSKEARFRDMMEQCRQVAAENKKQGKRGTVVCSRLQMMKEPEYRPGFLCVFPNFRHQGRKDGFGCRSLSPMVMGPIDHQQPGLSPALNLENFHQGNKVFPSELDEKGNPTEKFFQTQKTLYQDPIPHRHKVAGTPPAFSVWVDSEGKLHQLSYVESRQFYCTFYERHAKKSPDFHHLVQLLEDGYNLNLVGYDGFPITRTVEEHYLDPSRPFGHERVLYTLLTEKEENYPWRKHATFDF